MSEFLCASDRAAQSSAAVGQSDSSGGIFAAKPRGNFSSAAAVDVGAHPFPPACAASDADSRAQAAAIFSHYADRSAGQTRVQSEAGAKQDPRRAQADSLQLSAAQVREGARALRAALGEFYSDPDAVLRVLNQHPEVVRSVCALYDAELSRGGQGLAAELKKYLDEPYRGVAEALLARAGVGAAQHALRYVKQSTGAQARSRHAIVASPAIQVAVPGTEVSYSVAKEAEIYTEGSYYAYQWMCLNDPQSSKAHGKPELIFGPTNTPSWSARWDFPGNHKVLCRVQFREKNPGTLSGHTSHAPEYLEYQQTVQKQGEVLARALDRAQPRASPDEQLRMMQSYEQALLSAEAHEGSDKLAPRTKEALATQLAQLRERLKSSEGHTRYALKAAHVAAEHAQVSQLNVFAARIATSDEHETWILVDLTNPGDRRLSGEYRGTGKDAQHALQSAIAAWESGNRYPKGRLRVKVPLETGANLDQEFQTDGMSFWDSVSEFMGLVGFWAGLGMMGAAALATIAPDPAVSKVVAALLWTSILSGTAGASINLVQRYAEGRSSAGEDAFDTLTLVGNILGARWALGATVKGLSLAGSRMGTAVVIGRVGTDAAQGILLSVEYVKEYRQILAEPDPKNRTDQLMQLLGKAAFSGGMLVLSLHGSKAELAQLGAQKGGLAKLGHAGETIELAKTPVEETPPSKEPHPAATEPHAAPAAGQNKGYIVDPVPGLYASIDATPNVAPPGWTFRDQKHLRPDIPGAIQYRTTVTGPNGKEGAIQRIYAPQTKQLIMDFAFLDELPNKIQAGIPLKPGEGTPTVTYLTLRQMKMSGVPFAELKTVRMRHIQNFDTLLHIKQLCAQGLSLDEAARQTHSVRYATTSIQQSGHTVVGVRVDSSESSSMPIGELMERREARQPDYPSEAARVQKHEELLARYGMKRSDMVLLNFDIELELVPHPKNPQ